MGAGALACFFSDGLVEARSGSELLGRSRLAELLTARAPQPDASTLVERVRAAAPTAPDDMAACVIEPTTAFEPRPVWSEELNLVSATGAFARAERFLRACRIPSHEISRALALVERTLDDQGGALVRAEHDTVTAVTVSGAAGRRTEREPTVADRSAQPVRA